MTAEYPPAAAAEMQLLQAAQRVARQGPAQSPGRAAVILHLSALRPPAPRPHHRRIARAVLQDAAQRHGGQVFALRNGDIALLCNDMSALPAAAGAVPSVTPGIATLADALLRLLWVDALDPARLVSVWPLATEHLRLLGYATARAEERLPPPLPSEEEPTASPSVIDEVGALIGEARIHDLIHRQTAVLLVASSERDSGADPPGETGTRALRTVGGMGGRLLSPIYREVTFSIAALDARIAAGGRAAADPFLFRHLAGQLDRRMLETVVSAIGRGGPLDPGLGERGAPPLHLNLTLDAILTPGFARFADLCRRNGTKVGIEISLIDACADPARFASARAVIAQANMALVLDGVSHLALLLTVPGRLAPDMLKLDWSPRLAELADPDRRDAAGAIAAIGASRIVLQRAETEAALHWGLGLGIRRFQGRHVDAMLAASRIIGCAFSAGCTLRQCIERAGATSPAARAGCRNAELLDAAVPPRAAASGPVAAPHGGVRTAPARLRAIAAP